MFQVYLVRHAEVDERYHHIFGGRLDIGLSSRGEEQSRRLASWFREVTLDEIHASPMKRVRTTLVPCLGPDRPEPVFHEELREVDFGDWTGLAWAEVEQRFGRSAYDWLHVMDRPGFPGGESAADLGLRVHRAWSRICRNAEGKSIAVFAHGGVIRMILAHLLELPITAMEKYEVDYASVAWLEIGQIKAGRPRTEIQLLNFTPWRDVRTVGA